MTRTYSTSNPYYRANMCWCGAPTTVAYINRQGGVRSAALLSTAENLWLWASENVLSLKALHIPGVAKQIWAQFGKAEVDLFANQRNSHCTLWFSLARQDNPPLGVDAFAHEPWPRKLLYAFPPLRLMLLLLKRLRQERLSVILVAPDRRSAPWHAEVTQMMVSQPWTVPQVWGALSQEAGAIGALPTLGQPLQAWLLRGTG